MRRLEEAGIGERIILTLIIVLAVLFILAFIGWISGAWDEGNAAQAPPISEAERTDRLKHTCITDSGAREHLRSLMVQALDDALQQQWERLFLNWFADSRGQPDRARVGVSQALRAHQLAHQLAREWNPPICE